MDTVRIEKREIFCGSRGSVATDWLAAGSREGIAGARAVSCGWCPRVVPSLVRTRSSLVPESTPCLLFDGSKRQCEAFDGANVYSLCECAPGPLVAQPEAVLIGTLPPSVCTGARLRLAASTYATVCAPIQPLARST